MWARRKYADKEAGESVCHRLCTHERAVIVERDSPHDRWIARRGHYHLRGQRRPLGGGRGS